MEYELLLRVMIAGVCGYVIGFERKSRMKEAGVRTHFIVAAGSALMIIISKYGFQDQIGWSNLSLDPSRVAAGVVSGVGFLGAGMIFMQKHTVKGLTTAAGIWATAGIGMAVGAGMYFVGIGVMLIIFVGQIVLHGRLGRLTSPKVENIVLVLENEPQALERVLKEFGELQITVLSFEMEREEQWLTLSLTVQLKGGYDLETLMLTIGSCESVKKIKAE
ncbi:MgtC/SapB family protein [Paenibacillus fonticola]|uniref:MgtC/SapB family protein n=1 Tax=Paenibacillus fonticola TaxID=379896 RepID=UPI0003773AA0|nr:MgtC/SapB family protein [Paenibacillus fonticola]